MLDDDLLKLLADPQSHEALRHATAEEIARLNAAIGKGTQKNQGGQVVAEPLQEALVAVNSKRAYAVREGIAVLLFEEALPLA